MTMTNLTTSSFLQDASFNNTFLISKRTRVRTHTYLVPAPIPLKSCVFLMCNLALEVCFCPAPPPELQWVHSPKKIRKAQACTDVHSAKPHCWFHVVHPLRILAETFRRTAQSITEVINSSSHRYFYTPKERTSSTWQFPCSELGLASSRSPSCLRRDHPLYQKSPSGYFPTARCSWELSDHNSSLLLPHGIQVL